MDIFQISISCAIFEIHLHIKNHSLFIWNTNVTRSLIFLLNQATLPPAHDYSYSSILFIVLCLSTVGTRGKPYALNFSFSYSQQLPLNFILLLFSPSVVSDSLWPHGLQNARLPCPSLSLTFFSNSCPLSQWCHPTISSSAAPFSSCSRSFPASVFSNELALRIRWPKYWSFSFSISPSNKYSGLISFRIDWFDRLAVQGALKSLLQHHNSKASILWHSSFFMVQLSHLSMTTGKTVTLAIWTTVSKVMSLFFNMLSRFVIAFHPRGKYLSISRLQSPSAAISEPTKIKSAFISTFPPIYLPWSDGTGYCDLCFLNVEF